MMQRKFLSLLKSPKNVTITMVWRICMGGSASPFVLESPAQADALAASPALPETGREVVLKFRDRALLNALTDLPTPPASVLSALQDLMVLQQQLRSSAASREAQSFTATDLFPYVSDEVHDLLAAPQPQNEMALAPMESNSVLVSLATLSPQLLWCVARSGYSTMQLLEGTPARICAPGGDWQTGILRLAVIVEGRQTDSNWAIDLALGVAPHPAIQADWLIQLDQDSDFPVAARMTLDEAERSLFWHQRALVAMTEALVTGQPALQSWLEGFAGEWLTAGANWQSGSMRLKLELSFLPQGSVSLSSAPAQVDAIEAEFMDAPDLAEQGDRHQAADFCQPKAFPITVVEMPVSPTISTTMVRLALAETQAQFAAFAMQQEWVQCWQDFQHRRRTQPLEGLQLPFWQEFCRITDQAQAGYYPHGCLLQPELFMDELVPKLLWLVTRSSYPTMLWLGGMPCSLLQPLTQWQSGLLRLMVVLDLQTPDDRWWIDLATGRFLPDQGWQVPIGAIARLHSAASECVALEQVQGQCQQAIVATPELAALGHGIDIDWLTLEHDWQPGRLQLHLEFEFLPDLF
jgi:hypothetical protein